MLINFRTRLLFLQEENFLSHLLLSNKINYMTLLHLYFPVISHFRNL